MNDECVTFMLTGTFHVWTVKTVLGALSPVPELPRVPQTTFRDQHMPCTEVSSTWRLVSEGTCSLAELRTDSEVKQAEISAVPLTSHSQYITIHVHAMVAPHVWGYPNALGRNYPVSPEVCYGTGSSFPCSCEIYTSDAVQECIN